MTVDLASPLWGSIAAGIILMIIAGAYHYIRRLVEFNFTEKKLSNVLSEMYSLHTKYKEEITEIKKKRSHELTNTIDHAIESAIYSYSEKMDELLKHNKPPSVIGKPAITKNVLAEYMKNKGKTP